MAPVLNMKSAGSWFGTSVHMDRITQNSSIKLPTRGKISDTSMPLCPYLRKANGDANKLPVERSVLGAPPGIGFPLYCDSIGLGSKVSTCDMPPFITR